MRKVRIVLLLVFLTSIVCNAKVGHRIKTLNTEKGEYELIKLKSSLFVIKGPEVETPFIFNGEKWIADYSTEIIYDTTFVMVDSKRQMAIDTLILGRSDMSFFVHLFPLQSYDYLAEITQKCFSEKELSLLADSEAEIYIRPIVDSLGHVVALRQFAVSGKTSEFRKIPMSSYVRFYESIVSSVLYEDGGLMHKYGANYYSPVYDLLQFQFSPSGIRIVSFPNDPLNLETINELEKEGLTVRYKSLFTDQ